MAKKFPVSPNPEAELPLTPAVFNILLALSDGQKHGYAIMQEIMSASEGAVKMGPGTLYGSIDRMIKAGYIREVEARSLASGDDERRRYYDLSDFGRRVLRSEVARLAQLVALARAKKIPVSP